MHKQLLALCRIGLRLELVGPILIRTGLPMGDVDMSPVISGGRYIIPGSSLKGVFRSHSERIARTIWYDPNNHQAACCNPFDNPSDAPNPADHIPADRACSYVLKHTNSRLQRPANGAEAYRLCCPACRLFGALGLAGRFDIEDAHGTTDNPPCTEQRDGVGIDRHTGGSSQSALFKMQVLGKGAFETRLTITNFELWQLGWLAYILRDMSEGLVPVGGGKSRGLGKVQTTVESFQLVYYGQPDEVNNLPGLVGVGSRGAAQAYGCLPEGDPVPIPTNAQIELDWRGCQIGVPPESLGPVWATLAPRATAYLSSYGQHQSHNRSSVLADLAGGGNHAEP